MYCSRPTRQRPGNVVVMVAVSLVTLLGMISLSLDAGMLLDRRRDLQSAADASAMAGAGILFSQWASNAGVDSNGDAAAATSNASRANGYVDGENGCTLTINIPPTTGPHANQPAYVEVIIRYDHPRYFSRVFGSTNIPVSARAVARGTAHRAGNAVIALNPSSKAAFETNGGGTFTMAGSPIQVNSSHAEAMVANGNGSATAEDGFYVNGNPGSSTPGGGSFTGDITSSAPQMPDPLRFLPPPDPSAMPVRETKKLSINGKKTVILDPGVYRGGISMTADANVTLREGIYYMEGGGFNWGGSGTLQGEGVMIYNAPASVSDKIDLSGQGKVTLSPPTSGPYQGITFFQDRTQSVPVNVSGQGNWSITGTFYAAKATANVTGNGEANLLGSQYITDQLKIAGNGVVNITWEAKLAPVFRDLRLVE